jgi:hypothetical protein
MAGATNFGHPDAIAAADIAALPPQMQAEALLLLMERGLSLRQAVRKAGLEESDVHRLLPVRPLFSLANQWFEQIGSAG